MQELKLCWIEMLVEITTKNLCKVEHNAVTKQTLSQVSSLPQATQETECRGSEVPLAWRGVTDLPSRKAHSLSRGTL